MILPMYILGSAHAQGNLLPSVIAISLCCICIRGLCVYRESLTWQFSYCCLLISSFEIIVFYYNPDKTLESVNAIFWMLEITFLAVLLIIEFNLNVRKILSYPVFIFLLGGLMDVIPGMGISLKTRMSAKRWYPCSSSHTHWRFWMPSGTPSKRWQGWNWEKTRWFALKGSECHRFGVFPKRLAKQNRGKSPGHQWENLLGRRR